MILCWHTAVCDNVVSSALEIPWRMREDCITPHVHAQRGSVIGVNPEAPTAASAASNILINGH